MRLFHGSTTGGIEVLEPRLADHERPYIYLSTNDVVASFYIVNAVERPYYWFPYGFNRNRIPIYHELYPDALREVAEGKRGYLYEVEAEDSQLKSFQQIPCARLGITPLNIVNSTEIPDAYQWFLLRETENRLIIWRYENWKPGQLEWWDNQLVDYMTKKGMIEMPDCSYAKFVREKFPVVWERYVKSCSAENSKGSTIC
jgi:hypothetical protein